jgi:hypothetical protein
MRQMRFAHGGCPRLSMRLKTMDHSVGWSFLLSVVGGDLNWVGFVLSVGVVAAPRPLVGLLYESGSDGVSVHVTKFFNSLRIREDIEVMIARFPDKFLLAGAGEALFKNLDGGG